MATKVNTTKTVFKDSKVSDTDLSAKALKENQALVKKDRVKFYCNPVYHALYPNGFVSTCQGVYIELIFDGRTVELAAFIADYVNEKLRKKALAEVDKKVRNTTKKLDYLGMEYVG